jgi:transposase
MSESRRKFDEDFKIGAVRIVRESGKPIAQVARELGINEGTLGNWCAKDRRARGEGSGALGEDERAELERLRKDNAELTMQRDVLKRSVALWVLSRVRDKTHYAEGRIMPSGPVNRLRGKGFLPAGSA